MRYPPDLLARIRDTLADLYGTRGDILRVLDEAGIHAQTVNLEQEAQNVWHDIASEADKRGRVRALLTVAMREYPGDGDAGKTLEALLAGVAAADARKAFVPTQKNGHAA